jgi:hypothetical protein
MTTAIRGNPEGYLDDLTDKLYSAFLDTFLKPWPPDGKKMTAGETTLPEDMLVCGLFNRFLRHHDEKAVRNIFAKYGPKKPRKDSADRERFLLRIYLSEALPPKVQFARQVVDYNKTVPREKRLGPRSTSEINVLKYIDRMLEKYRDEVKRHVAVNRAWHDIISGKCPDKHN